MRICSIITSFTTGGAEVLVSNLNDGFIRYGHASTVLALCDAATLGNGIDAERSMMRRIDRSGGKARSLGLANRRNIVAGALRLWRLLAEIKPEIIHAHTAQAALILGLVRPSAPIVLTHHNSLFSFPLPMFRVFDRIVSGYIGISESCSIRLRANVRRPVFTIANAAGAEFEASGPRTLPAGDPVILSVGTLSAQKDYRTLIRAGPILTRLLAGSGRRPRIRIVGGGAPFAELEAFARREGGGAVEMFGERSDIARLLKASHLFVNSSVYEGLPVAMIEALATGLPLVATDVVGNRDLVEHGSNGLLVPARDPAALAGAMADLLTDSERYAAMSCGALEASRHFSMDAAVGAHLAMYRRVLKRSSYPRSHAEAAVGLNTEG